MNGWTDLIGTPTLPLYQGTVKKLNNFSMAAPHCLDTSSSPTRRPLLPLLPRPPSMAAPRPNGSSSSSVYGPDRPEQLERSGRCASSWASPTREGGELWMPAREAAWLGPAMALALLTPTGLIRLPATAGSNPSSDVVRVEGQRRRARMLSLYIQRPHG